MNFTRLPRKTRSSGEEKAFHRAIRSTPGKEGVYEVTYTATSEEGQTSSIRLIVCVNRMRRFQMGEYDRTGNGQNGRSRLGSSEHPVRHCKKLVGHPSDCLFGGNDNLHGADGSPSGISTR
ncbi:MAG: hypothetical protein ACLRIL_11480 [Fusicatenibacter saccharivorans]